MALYLLALVARLAVAALFPDPAYPDSFYYVDVARQLAAGHGFNVDFIWIFPEVGGAIPANPVLPIASNAHWMPLASIVQVPFIWLLGPTAMASALPFALFGALAAPLAWAIGRDAGAPRFVSIGAGILVAFPALSFVYMAQPDNFSLYQPLVAGSLWLAGRGLRGRPRDFVLAGLLAGIATLSRNDGVLVLAILVATVLWDRLRTRIASGGRPPRPARIPLVAAIGSVGLFVLAVAPWYARQLAVFGQLSPSTSSGRVLFIRDISEWNSITIPATLDHLLGMGIGPLLHDARRAGSSRPPSSSRSWSASSCSSRSWSPAPGAGGGTPCSGRSSATRSCCSRSARSSRRSTCPAGRSSTPRWRSRPRATCSPSRGSSPGPPGSRRGAAAGTRPRRARVFVGGAVAFGVLTAVVGASTVHRSWDGKRAEHAGRRRRRSTRRARRTTDRVMSIDASGYRYWTGHPGVVLVNDPLDTVEQVARAYGIRWLVLEPKDSVETVREILVDDRRPPWVGPPILKTDGVAVYPVCLDAADPRCPAGATGVVR